MGRPGQNRHGNAGNKKPRTLSVMRGSNALKPIYSAC
jgi:hypothetical protein